MQQVLPKWMWKAGLALFAMTVISATEFLPLFGIEPPKFRLASSLSSAAIILLGLIFYGRTHGAVWRMIWRRFPSLNRWVFPDLNGVWVGTAQSNWPAIAKLRDAAGSPEALDLNELFEQDLLDSPIVIQIKCNIFGISINSYQSNRSSKSKSLSSSLERDLHAESYILNYTYRQENLSASSTDSETHEGAAIVVLDYADLNEAHGSYWTKRCWEDGRNTAGKLILRRVCDRSDLSFAKLKEYL